MTRSVLAICLLVLSAVIVWAHTIELFYPAGILQVLEVFWGKVVLIDFVASLLLISVWIALLHPPEQRLTRGIPWGIGVVVLGTPVALLFFVLRASRAASAREVFLRPADAAES